MRHTNQSRSSNRGPEEEHRTPRLPILLLLPLLFLVFGCEGLLDVDLPGRVTDDDLDSPQLSSMLTNSVIADFECAMDNFYDRAAVHSDQILSATGNADETRWGMREIDPDFAEYAVEACDEGGALWTPMHVARAQSEKVFTRIQNFPEDSVSNREGQLATVRAYGAWTYVAFGEAFCGTPLDGSEQIFESAELYSRAVSRFGEAITLASDAGNEAIRQMALVGRARANLGLENYEAVISDVDQVQLGFRFELEREAVEERRQNGHCSTINCTEHTKAGSVAPSYRDVEWKGVDDPRVNAWHDSAVSQDFASPHFRHDKINSLGTNWRIASWEEAQLFKAEALAIQGELGEAIAILDGFHNRAGIPAVTQEDLPDQESVIRHVIEERRRELFIEGGHRLRDMLRWRGTQFEIPFLGDPGSDHPNGVNQTGKVYGNTTCFPVPLEETSSS